ncbi:hypothetical protein [Paenibacillus lactis]|uniref:hypothetical protein n=1 Tax=Paenibacillus lactis TaxID=228574 RepID=UPI003D74867E
MTIGIIDNRGYYIYKNENYKLKYRVAVKDEYIIATPETINLRSLIRRYNTIPYYQPIKVMSSMSSIVTTNYDCLEHGEYFVVCEIPSKKILSGEDVIVKRIFGIPFYRKVIRHYEIQDSIE